MGMEYLKIEQMFKEILDKLDAIDRRQGDKIRKAEPLDGDRLLDNADLCRLLGVTKRTLARYRQKKKVSYYMIDGLTYYKASEIRDFLLKKGKGTGSLDNIKK